MTRRSGIGRRAPRGGRRSGTPGAPGSTAPIGSIGGSPGAGLVERGEQVVDQDELGVAVADAGPGRVDERLQRAHPHRQRQDHRGDAGHPAAADRRDQAAARRAEDRHVVAGAEAPGLQGGADGPGLVVELAPRHERRLRRPASTEAPTKWIPVGASAASSSRSIVDCGRAIWPPTLLPAHRRIGRAPSRVLRAASTRAAPAETRPDAATHSGGSHRGRRRPGLVGWASAMSTDAPATSPQPEPRPRRRRRRPRPPLHGRARQRDRAALAGALGRQRHVRGAEPGRAAGRPRRRRRARPQAVRARHVPVPVGHRPARRPPAGLHRHRRLQPLPAHGRAQRPVLDGLRRLRAARRAVRRADRHAPGDHDGRRT